MRTNSTHEPLLTADEIRDLVMYPMKGDYRFLATGLALQAVPVAFGIFWFALWGYLSFDADATTIKFLFGMIAGFAITRTRVPAKDLFRSVYHLFASLAAKAARH